MAEQVKKYLDLEGLKAYDGKIKTKIADDVKTETDRAKAVEGTLSTLTTDAKGNLVAAINEIDAHANTAQQAADKAKTDATKGINDAKTAKQAADAAQTTANKGVADAKTAQDAINALKTYVGTIPADATAVDIVNYIKEVAATANADVSQVAKDLAQELKDRAAGDKAINDKIGTVADGKTVVGLISEAQAAAEKKTTDLENGQVKLNKEAIAVLQGTAETEGSVAYQIAQIVAGADVKFDTLKEIADWILSDTSGAAKMQSDIKANATAIANEKSRAEGVESGLSDRLDTVESALGADGSVTSQITAAIEKLDSNATKAAGADGLALEVHIVDGKLTSINGSIAANTYDKAGAADTVRGSTTETVASVNAKVDAIGAIDTTEINALFTAAEA